MKFPKEGKFTTKEEIEEYFSGEKIQCLECGKKFKKLALHLLKIHGITADDYKEIYGLPFSKGLQVESLRVIGSANIKKLMAEGKINIVEALGKAHAVRDPHKQRHQPYQRKLAAQNLRKAHKESSIHELPCGNCGKIIKRSHISIKGKVICPNCTKIRDKKDNALYRKKHAERLREWRQEYYQKNKENILQKKSERKQKEAIP